MFKTFAFAAIIAAASAAEFRSSGYGQSAPHPQRVKKSVSRYQRPSRFISKSVAPKKQFDFRGAVKKAPIKRQEKK